MLTKLQAQYNNLQKALKKLSEALARPETEISRDATIQRFEFTFEMSWKVMHSIAKTNKPKLYGVKAIIREAAALSLINDPKQWLKFLEDRNLTVHTYKEELAKQVYANVKKFPQFVEQLLVQAKTQLDS
ncbi:nucleotidyltransferase substrate binding protein [Patescibacteria group bacterium]|nr:nucleotidyltransferase substrate binding protein [Patescibacteria group bacterium]MBU1499962.1 nucleotidyltransferase substrate binding protein [Patescibacteria group bacterium]